MKKYLNFFIERLQKQTARIDCGRVLGICPLLTPILPVHQKSLLPQVPHHRITALALWLNGLSLVALLTIALYAWLTGQQEPTKLLFMQAERRQSPGFGLFAQVFNVLWCGATVLGWVNAWQQFCLLRRWNRFLLATALLMSLVLLDETLRLTTVLTVSYGVPKLAMVSFYATLFAAYGMTFWRSLRATRHAPVLLTAIGFLGLANGVDLLGTEGDAASAFAEGVPEVLGALNLLLFAWLVWRSPGRELTKFSVWRVNGLLLVGFGLLAIDLYQWQPAYFTYLLFRRSYEASFPFYGALVSVTHLLLTAAFSLCLICDRVLAPLKIQGGRFFRWAAVGLGALLADSLFRLTILLDLYGNAPVGLTYLLYAAIGLGIGCFIRQFWRCLVQTPYGLLFAAIGWLAVSFTFTLVALKQHGPREALERATRLLAAINLVVYFGWVGWQLLRPRATKAVGEVVKL